MILIIKNQLWKEVMKKLLTGIILIVISLSCRAQDSDKINELIDRNNTVDTFRVIHPNELQTKINKLVTTILSRGHYKKIELNDSLSSNVFDSYLEILDNNKMYFLKKDIESFEKYRYSFDDFLKQGDLAVAYDIFNTYKNRVTERINFTIRLLDKEFDYTIDEYVTPDRKNSDWAKTVEELNEIWRVRVKSDALNRKLNGEEWSKISDTLKKRYMYFHKTLLKYESEDVFQFYLNAFSEAIEPHTNYLAPITAENFGISMSLSLEGIGAQLTSRNDYTTITSIIPGGPADKSGKLKVDDKIVAVGQNEEGEMIDVVGWRLDDVIQLIRGKKGTLVRLLIEKGNAVAGDKPMELKLIRDKIKLEEQAAKSEILNIEENGISYKLGVIDIPGFYLDFEGMRNGDPNYKSTTRDVAKILENLKKEKVDGVIIDLRDNGGGSLQEAVSLTGLFIENGPVVQVRNSNNRIDVENDPDNNIAYSGPLCVVVNRGSASASEIFSAAIQDYGRGLIVGSQTYGKGTVQNLVDLNKFMPSAKEDLGQLKMTIAKFYRINGSSTQRKGVTPDIQFPEAFSSAEFGESSNSNAMPWDQIGTASFKKFGELSPYIPKLNDFHEKRVKNEKDYQFYAEDVNEAIENRKTEKFSLNEKIRKQEQEILEAKRKMRDEEKNKNIEITKKSVNEDPLLKESGRILADYIGLKVG